MALHKMQNPQINLRPSNSVKKEKNEIKKKELEKSRHREDFEARIKKFEIDSQQLNKKEKDKEEKQVKDKMEAVLDLSSKEQQLQEQERKKEELSEKDFKEEMDEEQKIVKQISKLRQRLQIIKGVKQGKRNIEEVSMVKPEVKKPRKILKFPEDFLWGTSTSAYQVEGGNKNDWSQWESSMSRLGKLMKKDKDSNDFICGAACDSYHHYEEDFDLAKKLNNNAIRFGLEWSRIEPKKDTWNVKEINHYRDVMEAAKKRGLKTVVTLWHWTNPIWLAKEGGWSNDNVVKYFSRYTELVVKELGSYIDYWVTLNEPMVPIGWGYIKGSAPPNKKLSLINIFKVFFNLIKAHKKSYELIHKHFPNAIVSITQLTNYFEPAHKWCPVERLFAFIARFFHQHYFYSLIKDHLDYIGLDYYFHDQIVWYPPFKKNKNERVSDMGWEIYPEGIYYTLKYLSRFNKPILITENGIADAEDKFRADFIKQHLYYVNRAMAEGVDVRGYFYWSLLDNFEWNKGFGPKFGLYTVDRKTFKRIARPSARVYGDICRNNRIQI